MVSVKLTSAARRLEAHRITPSRTAPRCIAHPFRHESPTPTRREPGFREKIRRRPTLPHGDRAVPSALEGLTAVFEMGTGVSPPLSPPETGLVQAGRTYRQKEQARGSSHQAEENYGQASRPFSTGYLHALR